MIRMAVLASIIVMVTSLSGYGYDTTIVGNNAVPRGVYEATYKWSQYYGVDFRLALALSCQESSWNQSAVGTCGEVGVYQIMFGTICEFNRKHGTSLTRYDLDNNCQVGVWYLSQKMKKYNGDYIKAVATYNCGDSNVDYWMQIATTRRHVMKIIGYYDQLCGGK